MSADGFGAPGGDGLVTIEVRDPQTGLSMGRNVRNDDPVTPGESTKHLPEHLRRLQTRLDWLERRWGLLYRLAGPELKRLLDATEAAARLIERGR